MKVALIKDEKDLEIDLRDLVSMDIFTLAKPWIRLRVETYLCLRHPPGRTVRHFALFKFPDPQSVRKA